MFKNKNVQWVFVSSIIFLLLIVFFDIFLIYPAFQKILKRDIEDDACHIAEHIFVMMPAFSERDGQLLVTETQLQKIEKAVHDVHVQTLRIFNSEGHVIYSTDAEEVGRINTEEHFHTVVASGNVFTQVVKKKVVTAQGVRTNVSVVESYVPVMSQGRFAGAIEVYQEVEDHLLHIHYLSLVASCGLLAVSALLLGVVFFALKNIDKGMENIKKTENDAHAAKARVEHLLAVVPSAVFVVNRQKRIIFWNKKAEEITGFSAEEVIGKDCAVFSLSPCAQVCDLFSADVAKPLIAQQCVVKTKRGEERLVAKNTDVLRDEHGLITGGIESFEDITERQQAAEALRKSEARHRSFIEVAGQLGWVANAQGKFIQEMSSWCLFTGQAHDAVKGDGWIDAVHPEDKERVFSAWKKAVSMVERYETDYRLRRYDGVYRFFVSRAVPMRNSVGEVQEWIGTSSDITEQKRIQESIAKEARKNSSLVSVVGQIVYERYLSDDHILWSGSFTELLGYSREEMGTDARTWLEKVHPDDIDAVRLELDIAVAQERIFDVEYRFRHKNGRYLWLHDRGVISKAMDGSIANIGLMEDITLRRSFEKQLAANRKKLASVNEALTKSNAELEQFAYVASHDLQEPLRKIVAFGELLQRECADLLSVEGIDYLSRMRNAASRMQKLIGSLLLYSRITTRGTHFVSVDFNKIVHDALNTLELRVQETGAVIVVPDTILHVYGDAVQLEQLMQNILSNALKYQKEGAVPRVEIHTSVEQDMALITVTDNGIGFHERYAEKIFEPFRRLHGRSEYEGAGIGLSICQKIVVRHGGVICAKSVLGEGSSFTVKLPLFRE